jgi:hypothetical protein
MNSITEYFRSRLRFDRSQGVVRYISLGASEEEIALLGELIKKLVEEK